MEDQHSKVILGKLSKAGGRYLVVNVGSSTRLCGKIQKPWDGSEIILTDCYGIDTIGTVADLEDIRVIRSSDPVAKQRSEFLVKHRALGKPPKTDPLIGLTFTSSKRLAVQIASHSLWIGHHA